VYIYQIVEVFVSDGYFIYRIIYLTQFDAKYQVGNVMLLT